MSRMAIIWISSPELSYVCHTFAMLICALMWAEKFVIKILVSCILVYSIIYETKCFLHSQHKILLIVMFTL